MYLPTAERAKIFRNLVMTVIEFHYSVMTIASVTKAKRVFQALIKLGIEELCEAADSLIAPVRLGVARPTANFSLSSSTIDVVSVSECLSRKTVFLFFLNLFIEYF